MLFSRSNKKKDQMKTLINLHCPSRQKKLYRPLDGPVEPDVPDRSWMMIMYLTTSLI